MNDNIRFKIANWRIDEDGMLRVTACVLKEGVFDYTGEDIPQEFLGKKSVLHEYIPATAFTEDALKTLEGKPTIVYAHEWRTPDNTQRDGLTVGSIAGSPIVGEAPDGEQGILCDFLITDSNAIEAIKTGKLVEVSAAYESQLNLKVGAFKDVAYDAVQTDFRFNHVLLLPTGRGRCGSAVRIINSGENKMSYIVKIKIGNQLRTLTFTNEADGQVAESALAEEQSFNADQLADSMQKRGELATQIAELQKQLAEHDAKLNKAKEEIERLLSPEAQQSAAEEIVEQSDDEELVVNEDETMAEAPEEEKEKVMNAIRSGKTLSARRKNCVTEIFKRKGVELPTTWNETAYDAAFETLVTNAKHREAHPTTTKVANGTLDKTQTQNGQDDAKSRMLRPMKAFSREDK